jgi:hypothetical protein
MVRRSNLFNYIIKKENVLLLIATLIVLLSRLPFLKYGYGLDQDAWGVANTARDIAKSHQYSMARPPGSPLSEIFYSLIWNSGPFIFNLVTALFSSIMFLFFALSLRELKLKNYLIAALALAFTPIIYINSTTSMDYIWALAMICGALYYSIGKKPVIAGIYLGIATTARITSGAMLIPLGIILLFYNSNTDNKNIKNKYADIITFTGITLLIGIAGFLPAFLKYGSSFFTFYECNYNLLSILKMMSLEIWGQIGLISIFAVLSISIIFKLYNRFAGTGESKIILLSCLSVVILYGIAFLRLPAESAYLIPIIPFVIISVGLISPQKIFLFFCAGIIISPFIGLNHSLQITSPVINNYAARKTITKEISNIVQKSVKIHGNSVIVCGYYLPQVQTMVQKYVNDNRCSVLNSATIEVKKDDSTNIRYVWIINSNNYPEYSQKGYKIYYLKNIDEFSLTWFGYDISKRGTLIQ